jgi:hypothetical protein
LLLIMLRSARLMLIDIHTALGWSAHVDSLLIHCPSRPSITAFRASVSQCVWLFMLRKDVEGVAKLQSERFLRKDESK